MEQILKEMTRVKERNMLIDPNGLKYQPYPSSDQICSSLTSPESASAWSHLLVDITYGETVMHLLATLEEDGTTDLTIIKNSTLIKEETLLSVEPPPGKPYLHESISWIIQEIKDYQTSLVIRNEEIRPVLDIVEGLKDAQCVTEYEASTEEDKVTFLLKSSIQISFSSLELLVNANRIVNTNNTFYVLKLVYNRENGTPRPKEFCVQFSAEIAQLLPPADTLGISQFNASGENLEEYIMNTKECVEEFIRKEERQWKERAQFLLSVKAIYPENSSGVDVDKMDNIKLMFTLDTCGVVIDISLDRNFPQVPPSYSFSMKEFGNGHKICTKKLKKTEIDFDPEWKKTKMALELANSINRYFTNEESLTDLFS